MLLYRDQLTDSLCSSSQRYNLASKDDAERAADSENCSFYRCHQLPVVGQLYRYVEKEGFVYPVCLYNVHMIELMK